MSENNEYFDTLLWGKSRKAFYLIAAGIVTTNNTNLRVINEVLHQNLSIKVIIKTKARDKDVEI